MRKASRVLIAENLAGLDRYLAALPALSQVDGLNAFVAAVAADIRERITAGDCTHTTQALVNHLRLTVRRGIAGEFLRIRPTGSGGHSFDLRPQGGGR